MKTAAEIRSSFLEFFEERGHQRVPSAPVFPKDDPTLLFANAGMNQFKDVFLGTGTRDYKRAVDTQKCIRVSGKHNDLEEVGRDSYHHTLFEMLGNWSFGDYFKKDAIVWAWEFLTEVLELPKERLWVTVFGGNESVAADEESESLWRELTDIAPERVLRFGAKDNFWEMGETGPCGPCTEIHYDRGTPDDDPEDGANPAIGVNAGNERFIELWNLVFIQYDRKKGGDLVPLSSQHVDTGMGLERVVAVIQGQSSNYDTDLFQPIFAQLETLCQRAYTRSSSDADVAFRVIADHIRALCCAIADGALPGNEGRGYVLRRLLRRASRFGRQSLGMTRPFIYKLVPAVETILGDVFPEIAQRRDHIELLIEAEEKSFSLTLDKGIVRFEELASRVEKEGSQTISGEEAYDLYATYGFPHDLVELMARERGLKVDAAGWEAAQAEHREASRGEGGGKWLVDPSLLQSLPATKMLYHEEGETALRADAHPLKLVDDRYLVLHRTPFYAESGGQVGDAGRIVADGFLFIVEDVRKIGQVVLHVGELKEGDAANLPALVHAQVDEARRLDIMANHSGTHLLHWALQEVLGEHANQQGSLVAPDKLRFDVSHPKALSDDELERIEALVNAAVAKDDPLHTSVENLDAAKARGVTALFGEKYEEDVRVVDIGGYSLELCGGIHCHATGQIGAFAITSEAALQAGVRRIEAVTRGRAISWMQQQRRRLREVARALKTSEAEVLPRLQALQNQVKELRKGGAQKAQSDLDQVAKALLAKAEDVGGVLLIKSRLEGVGGKEVSLLCDRLKATGKTACGVLGIAQDGKVVLAAFATKDIAGKGVHAGKIVKEAAAIVGGGGGGRPDFAQAGGKKPEALGEALELGAKLLREGLGG